MENFWSENSILNDIWQYNIIKEHNNIWSKSVDYDYLILNLEQHVHSFGILNNIQLL